MPKPKALISACLMGQKCRYDGKSKLLANLNEYAARFELIPICPELDGGLPVPRPKAWIERGNGNDVWNGTAKVINEKGNNVTEQFKAGAQIALKLAIENSIKTAILKSKSPSCGAGYIYHSNSNNLVEGNGVTASLLLNNGMDIESIE